MGSLKTNGKDVESENIECLNVILPMEGRNCHHIHIFSIKASLASKKHEHHIFQPDSRECSL